MHSPIVVQLIDADCSSNLLEITYIRNYASDTYSESWNLYLPDTSTVLYSSEQFPIIGTTTGTICVQRTPSLQYDLEMISTTTTSKSSLAFQGTYENRVFKSSWKLGRIRLSFYTPIFHGVFWFWTSNYSPDWKTCSTDSWSLTTGTSISSDSVIYFRRSFTGLSNMAAYESQFYYRDGIIAYLNGYEIYRDNMGTGPILPSSKPISSYSSYSYHGVIRNGYDVSESECILSVEIHLPQSVSIQFHSWLSIYASSMPISQTENCYPVPVNHVTYGYYMSLDYLHDYVLDTLVYITYLATDIFFAYEINRAQVNKWEVYEGGGYCPASKATMEGRMTGNDTWTRLRPSFPLRVDELGYYYFSFTQYDYRSYPLYRFTPTDSSCTPVYFWELHPLTCYERYSIQRTLNIYDMTYSLTIGQQVNIVASNADAVGCMSDPSLPGGLAFHECSIVGSPTESVTDLMIQVYWQDDYGTMSQQVTISVTAVDIPKKKSSSLYFVLLGVIIVVLVILLWFGCRSKDKKGKLIRVHLDPPIPGPPIYEPPQSLKIGHKVPMNIGQSSSVDQSISSLNEGQYPQDSHRFSTPIQSSVSPSLGSTTVVSADPQKSPVSLSPSMQPQLSVAPYTSQSVQVPGLKVPSTMRSNDMSMMPSPGPSQSFTPSGRLVSAGNSSRVSVRCSKSTIVKDENGNDVDLESLPFHARLQYTKDSGA